MVHLFQRIKRHPVIAATVGVVGGLASVWGFALLVWSSFNVQDAMVPTVWAKVKTMQVGYYLLFVFPVVGLTLSVALILLVVVSAVQNKREVERLREQSGLQDGRIQWFERKLDEGDFSIQTPAANNLSLNDMGRIFWRDQDRGREKGQLWRPKDMAAALEAFKLAADTLTTQRDQAVVALRDKKYEYAMEVLGRYSNIRFKDDIKPSVTIRYCSYGDDYELAMRIKGLFTQYVRWEVLLDGSNRPALPRAEQFKVVFDVGMTVQTYGALIHAISEGDLLGATVGQKQFVEREDAEHVIIMVLPSADAGLASRSLT